MTTSVRYPHELQDCYDSEPPEVFDVALSSALDSYESEGDDGEEYRLLLLCEFLRAQGEDAAPDELINTSGWNYDFRQRQVPHGTGRFTTAQSAWMVVTDQEADDLWDSALDSYLDDCVPGSAGPYFDSDAWKRDARCDGRGHALNGYDGAEEEHRLMYIYRTN